MRHIHSILLENEAGALSRVAGLFSARGYNIESLSVAPTDDPTLSRMTLVTYGDDDVIEQITKQVNKLVDVVKLALLTENEHVEREMLLLKVAATGEMRAEAMRLAEIFDASVVDVTATTYVLEATGEAAKLDALVNAVGSENVLEIARTGVSGIARGEAVLTAPSY